MFFYVRFFLENVKNEEKHNNIDRLFFLLIKYLFYLIHCVYRVSVECIDICHLFGAVLLNMALGDGRCKTFQLKLYAGRNLLLKAI